MSSKLLMQLRSASGSVSINSYERGNFMKRFAVAAFLAVCIAPEASFAQAMNADDLKWVNQCIADRQR